MFAIVRTTHLVSGMLPHNSIACTYCDVPLCVRGISLSLSLSLSLSSLPVPFICIVSSCLAIKFCRKYKNYVYNCSDVQLISSIWPNGVVFISFLT
jgi:hypothetical protein